MADTGDMLTFEKRRERALLSYLDVLSNRDAVLSYQQIQGLLFAMASSPESVRPIEWFELIWLSDDPQFDDAGEAKTFFQLLLELSRHIGEEARGERYRPGLDAQGHISGAAMADWCDGFLLGHQYLEDVWQIALEDLDDDQLFDQVDEALNTAIAFAAGEFEVEGAEDALLTARLQFQGLLDVYHSVHLRWSNAKRPWDVYACYDELEPVARDALCPCGSGRQFAQCCLH
jgi:yecA family protein